MAETLTLQLSPVDGGHHLTLLNRNTNKQYALSVDFTEKQIVLSDIAVNAKGIKALITRQQISRTAHCIKSQDGAFSIHLIGVDKNG